MRRRLKNPQTTHPPNAFLNNSQYGLRRSDRVLSCPFPLRLWFLFFLSFLAFSSLFRRRTILVFVVCIACLHLFIRQTVVVSV
ncbi:hypothetical protein QBC35DRAFT_503355 [Podospora australis]|uniref:Transmembrane protein n=1 Tax=Podospora australis TaxID=1536484 RepID=A0AAN6WP14_9PEZI|nr:hypothetical protein QBC35DRAFT_503355 [Podospora australis]